MGTRAKIKLVANEADLTDYYISMDGHVPNWAPKLIVALSQTTPAKVREIELLLSFFNGCAHINDEGQDYLCVIDSSEDEFMIKVYRYDKLIFTGTLSEFSRNYTKI